MKIPNLNRKKQHSSELLGHVRASTNTLQFQQYTTAPTMHVFKHLIFVVAINFNQSRQINAMKMWLIGWLLVG